MATELLNSTIRADGETVGEPGRARGIVWAYPEQRFTPFDLPPAIVGRGEDATVRLVGAEVSRHHAEITLRGPVATLRDLGSTNGTHHNGARIGDEPVALADQDIVRLGEWLGVVCTSNNHEPPQVDTVGLHEAGGVSGLIAGPSMQALLQQVQTVASSDLPVILLGESGTGKELVSELIHRGSGRGGKLVAVNCAALPANLVESELFGHTKGAFTGAERAAIGHFRAADRGSLLLDEIGDLPLSIQPKLLRALEAKEVVPLGSSNAIRIDVRVIVAGQHALGEAVKSGRFRGDLYARLNGIELRIPPLRQRREEILPIFQRVVERELAGHPLPRFRPRLLEMLCLHDWPFNVRELVQAGRQMAVMHRKEADWTESLLPAALKQPPASTAGASNKTAEGDPGETAPETDSAVSQRVSDQVSLKVRREREREQELQALQRALDECCGNVSEAARRVGISRRKAYRLLKELDAGVDLD